MKLPPLIEIRVNCPQGGDLSGLIFQVRVTAGPKNLFYIFFPKTSADGVARLTSEDFHDQFADHYEMGTMDYSGTVETAGDVVTLELFDPCKLLKQKEMVSHWPLLKHEKKTWKSREEVMGYFLSCSNQDYYFFEVSFRIPADGVIGLTVGRKIGARPANESQ